MFNDLSEAWDKMAETDAPPSVPLDDRQAPVWTLKEPGVLAHRSGRYSVEIKSTRAGPRTSAVIYFLARCGGQMLGKYETPELAKAAAEQHAAWCEEFGLTGGAAHE